MHQAPLPKNDLLDQLYQHATTGTKPEAEVIANACLYLTGDADDERVIARWPEIRTEFSSRLRARFPNGLKISVPRPSNWRLQPQALQPPLNLPPGVPPPPDPWRLADPPADIKPYRPSLRDALYLWDAAKCQVFASPTNPATEPISSPQAPPPRRLLGGSAGDATLADADEPDQATDSSSAAASLSDDVAIIPQPHPTEPVVIQPSPSASAQPRDAQREVTVRPAKPASNGAPISNATAPQPRWTREELKVALREADAITQLVNGDSAQPDNMDANARGALLDSWTRGVTLPKFAPQLFVGRNRVLSTIKNGIGQVQAGGGYFQILTGLNGYGKSSLLDPVDQVAFTADLAVARVELTAEDRFYDTAGATRQLLSKLLSKLQVNGDPAVPGLVLLLNLLCGVALNGAKPSAKQVPKLIDSHCQSLLHHPGGEDVVKVLSYYAQHAGDLGRQVKALKWLRAEYDSVTDARKDLGVSSIVGDGDFFKHLVTISRLCHLAGKRGLLVVCDELTVLVRNLHKSVRQANYDTILNVYNASASGQSPGLGFLFAGTPDCLDPRQNGLLAHPALASRLQIAPGPKWMPVVGPILELGPLQPVELFLALQKARGLVLGQEGEMRLPDLALEHLLDACLRPLGAEEFLPPREVLKRFASVVQHLEADQTITWQTALGITESTTNSPKGDVRPASHSSFQNLKL